MGMNKKEQAAFADLEYRLRLAKALRFTEPIERDVQPPACTDHDEKLRKGWDYNAYIGGFSGPKVEKACTSSIYHGFGDDTKTTTQRPKPLFSTRLLALRALRNNVETQVAEILAKIDEQIEEEKASIK